MGGTWAGLEAPKRREGGLAQEGEPLKTVAFHLMPYRHLPDDFETQHHSVWVDLPNDLYDPQKGQQLYDDYLGQLEYADELGFDGIGVNEHHQNAYGLMPSPNLMAAVLARNTRNAALVVLGNSLALYNPPLRVAEEYAMLDNLSRGRLVAGFVLGTAMDSALNYGFPPATLRERYREAHDLITQAWTRPGPFIFNGKYTRLRYVNPWPRPVQQPHPPIWVPGTGSLETMEWALHQNYMYCSLGFVPYRSYQKVMDQYWEAADRLGVDRNPYRAGIMQVVCVSESDARAEQEYEPHVMYLAKKLQHIPIRYTVPPGYMSAPSFMNFRNLWTDNLNRQETWRDMVDKGFIVAGSPRTVVDIFKERIPQLRAGHLLVLPQVGSMPDDLARKNLELIASEVIPHLKPLWQEYEDHWWPKSISQASS